MTFIRFRTIVLVVCVNLAVCMWLYMYSQRTPPAAEGSKSVGQCYSYNQKGQARLPLRSRSVRKQLECKRKLPSAILIGVKKGGTGALKFFLRYHPQISYTNAEPSYFRSKNFVYNKEAYEKMMAYSTPGQVTIEGSPSYFTVKAVAQRVKAALPNVKLILLLRDPVKRAISDYVHVQEMMTKKWRTFDDSVTRPDVEVGSRYEIASTFSESVFQHDGTLKAYNLLLVKGRYVDFLSRWLKYFSLERILIVDGGLFSKEPLPTLKKVEEFLGLTPYFTTDHFKFNEEKGFYCLQKPIQGNCLASNKGRSSPKIDGTVIKTLQDYFDPFNKRLNTMLNRTFLWST